MYEVHPEPWLYTATAILFLLPCALLAIGWAVFTKGKDDAQLPRWRTILTTSALLLALASTFIHFAWNISWLHSGGSPHGMGAGPGIWMTLRIPLLWTFGLAILGAFFAKGKCRLLLLGWAASMYLVFQMIYILQMD
jgi:hypothetical protein